MIPTLWMAVLMNLLGLALQWWLSRKMSGVPLNARELRQWNHFNAISSRIREYSISMGCAPSGEPDDAPEELMTANGLAEAEWVPGSIITDRLFEMIVRQLGLPAAKNLMAKLQAMIANDPDACVAFVLQLIKDQQ